MDLFSADFLHSEHPELYCPSNAGVSLSFRWEEECTMRMDLQQKIADLQEVISVHTLCRTRLRMRNASSGESSECFSSLLWLYFLLESFVTDNKILTYTESSHTSCSTYLEICLSLYNVL